MGKRQSLKQKTPNEVIKELRRNSNALRALAQTYMQATTPEYLSLAKNLGNIFNIVLEYDCQIAKAAKAISDRKGGVQ